MFQNTNIISYATLHINPFTDLQFTHAIYAQ